MKKTTIWTYVKRGFLSLILLVVVVFVSIYFLDVYKVSSSVRDYHNSYDDSYWTNLEGNGFVSFETISKELESINCNYFKGYDINNYKKPDSYIAPYQESDDPFDKLKKCRYQQELELTYQLCIKDNPSLDSDTSFNELYGQLNDTLDNLNNYTNKVFKQKTVLSNDDYELLLDLETTEFILNQKKSKTDEVIESWRSNPDSKDGESAFKNPQSSLFTITCVDGNKASTKTPIVFNSYAHSTRHYPKSLIDASFYVNEVKDESGNNQKVIVYYQLSSKGLDHTYIPQTITLARLRELFDRCNENVAKYKAEHDGKNPIDTLGNVIDGLVYAPKNNTILPDGSKISQNTIQFYSKVIDSIYNVVQYSTITGSDGTVYDNDTIDEHKLNPDCLDTLLDESGNPQVDENGYTIKAYRTCPICSNVKYEIRSYTDMAETSIRNAYFFLYDWCGYDMDQDFLIDTGTEKQEASGPKLTVALEYTLSENGLEVKIPGNSITTNKNKKGDYYMVTSMEVLPYFTSVKSGKNEGYVVIPDGSGVVMEFDNGKANYSAYSKRIYSSDLAFTSYTLKADTSDLLLPMYGYVFTNENEEDKEKYPTKAMVVEAQQGAAQVALKADTANRGKNSFNHANYSIVFRESQKIVIGTNKYAKNETTQYTNDGAFCDYTFSYMCLDLNKYDCSYSGVAKFYRDLLISRSEGKLKEDADNTTQAILNMDVLGSYSYDTNFLGIPYTGKESLTTTKQLEEIINEITKLGVEHINIYYKGWRSTNLKSVSFESMKVSSLIGGKKALLDLINQYNQNIKIYPYLEFTEYEKFQRSFGKIHYASRDVGGEYAVRYPYELNSNVFNKKLDQIKVLSPAYYDAFSKELSKNYTKLLDINTLAISGLGSKLSGDYRKKLTVFKASAVEEQIKALDNIYNAGITDIALETPYAYALEYATNVYNVPYQSTQYEILDYNIPFYQLVINGLFDYSGESINENVEKGLNEHILRCIETGSNPAFTFTYEDSSDLLQTDYNNYYYTLYSRWLDDVKTICNDLNNLGIYSARLVEHTRLGNEVYKVTYQNNVEKIEIIVNYQRIAWTDGTINVPAKSYLKLEN